MEFTIGCDPELMLADDKGSLKSAIPIINGTKHNPIALDGGGMLSHDNVAIEYGTKPASNEEEFVENNRDVLKKAASMLPKNIKMIVRAAADFPWSELDCDEAREFGCEPDFDAYKFDVNEMPEKAANDCFRTCGGHIHIGNEELADDLDRIIEVAKGFDVFLAIPSMLFSRDNSARKRRRLYGKAGAHRPKEYGVEYRSIDNFWVSSPDTVKLVYRLCRDGLNAIENGHMHGVNETHIRETVNSYNLNGAETILRDLVIPMIGNDTRNLLNKVIDNNGYDLYREWGIK